MQLLWLWVLLGSLALMTEGASKKDVICGKGSYRKTVVLKAGNSFSFKTQRGSKYKRKTNCKATFKRAKGQKCDLEFSCQKFSVTGKGSCKGRSDFIYINKKKYCGKKAPTVKAPGSVLRVLFRSHPKSRGNKGAQCTITCKKETPTTVAPKPIGGGSGGSGDSAYRQDWLRGPGDNVAHVHEGIYLADGSGFVAVGETSDESAWGQIVVTRVNNEGAKQWTKKIGTEKSTAHAVLEVGDKLVVAGGLYQASTSRMSAVLVGLETANGNTAWTRVLDHQGFGAVRGIVRQGDSLFATGYIGNNEPGFVFIADGDTPAAIAWKFDLEGNLVKSQLLGVEGMSQGAKIRADPVQGGLVIVGSRWNQNDDQQCVLVKIDSNLGIKWNKDYGLSSGSDQCFDMIVDSSGNYLLGGHTTAGVTNWDYLAIKVLGSSGQEAWRRTYGQPRGFDPKWIHDEMWGVALEPTTGNYLLLGGSGDEYAYSATAQGWRSDTWVSYLVVVSPEGNKISEGIFGDPKKDGNEAGEYLAVDTKGDIMVFTDSDTTPGFGFLKLVKNS